MIDKEKAVSFFNEYVSHYDFRDSKVSSKITHTYNVAENAERISKSLGMSQDDINFSWFIGLLHDIGRFEQVRRYGTFIDIDSVDHAELGADILFNDGLINSFQTEKLSEQYKNELETAVRLHNKLKLPDNLDSRSLVFCQIIRDSDKVDILRVVTDIPFEKLIGKSQKRFITADYVSTDVMKCVYEHRCISRQIIKTIIENRISHGCMAFEIIYNESRKIIREQGSLRKFFQETEWPETVLSQIRILREELEAAWGMSLWLEQ